MNEVTEQEISRKIKQELLTDFSTNNRKGIYAMTQKIMAYNSNKIEGSTLTSEQTASLFDTGTIVSNGVEVYKAKDIEEMNGHFKMFNQMLKFIDEPLSKDLIKSYHYQLKSGVFEDMANGYPIGEFKNRKTIVSDIQTVNPLNVDSEMTSLLNDYYESEKDLLAIAKYHANYERIHPFQDGNGRTGRIIIFKQCLDSKIIPVVIKDDTKELYYNALHSAQVENDFSKLIKYFSESQQIYFNYIKDFLNDYKELNTNHTINENKYIINESDTEYPSFKDIDDISKKETKLTKEKITIERSPRL